MKDDLLEGLRPEFYADYAEHMKLPEELLRDTSENRIRMMRFILHSGEHVGFFGQKNLHDYIEYFKIMIQIHQEMVIAIQQELEEEKLEEEN